jgi:hypothetical protein
MNPRTEYPELDLKPFQDGTVDTRNPPWTGPPPPPET